MLPLRIQQEHCNSRELNKIKPMIKIKPMKKIKIKIKTIKKINIKPMKKIKIKIKPT